MKDFVILPDCTCDISQDAMKEIGMTEYIPGHVNFNGTEYPTTLDWTYFTREEYYKTLSNKKAKVTTAPPSPAEFAAAFEKYVKQGVAVLINRRGI
jgi:fatty acid-binding protein DegV